MTQEKARALLVKISYKGPLTEFKFQNNPSKEVQEAYHHLREVEKIATLMGIPKDMLQFGPNLTRGLDYFTGVVFETFIQAKRNMEVSPAVADMMI